MACVSSLLNLARKRADYVEFAVEVVDSLACEYCILHKKCKYSLSLPDICTVIYTDNVLEAFSESQRSSIRKQLKVFKLD